MTSKDIKTGDVHLDAKITEWLQWNKDPKHENEIQNLICKNYTKALVDLFLKRIEFGTAGLRSRMGPGYSQMNDLVIIQTGQGLREYLINSIDNVKDRGIIIGYDGRHNSKRFAELTAAVFLVKNIKVYMFSKVCPTPFIPFGVTKYKCAAGIMITASHNPKDDNGYKVYWSDGVQINSPNDKNIQNYILKNLKPEKSSWDILNISNNPSYIDPLNDILESYFSKLKEDILYPEINTKTKLKFTYTPMHGVGRDYMAMAFDNAHFEPFIDVEEQKLPDPEFSTVKFPNPEEGKSALELSIKTANENASSIILANDPDADRLGCAMKAKNGEWYIFSGNELGALLGWWMIHKYQVRYPDANFSNAFMISSTVSSKILSSMAKKEGFNVEETLTGFKWMGGKALDLIEQGKNVLFAFEEAIGYMCGTRVLDKDGISAGVCVAEMAAYLETLNLTLHEKLEEIYKEYGYHVCNNSYWNCYEPEKIKKIFDRLRNHGGHPNTYPTSIHNGKYPIIAVRDLTTGYDNTKPGNKAVLPVSKSSQMITFVFANGTVTTLRTSGTEPKIKHYNEISGSLEEQSLDKLKNLLDEMVNAIVKEFLQPDLNGLTARSA